MKILIIYIALFYENNHVLQKSKIKIIIINNNNGLFNRSTRWLFPVKLR